MASDWWARRLGTAPTPQTPTYPTPGVPNLLPATHPQQFPQQPQTMPVPTNVAERIAYTDPNEQLRASGAYKAGDRASCPACQSNNFFSRSFGARLGAGGQMVNPSPQCFDCGFPLRQQGSGQ